MHKPDWCEDATPRDQTGKDRERRGREIMREENSTGITAPFTWHL